MKRNTYPTMAAAAMAVIFGLSFLFTKGLLSYLTPLQLMGMRFAVAALVLIFLAALRLVKLNLVINDLPPLLGAAILSPGLYFIFETYGVKLTTASISSVIISLIPVATAVFAFFMLGERITVVQGAFITAAVAGVMLMALGGGDGSSQGSSHMLGILLLVGAVASSAVFNIVSNSLSGRYSPIDITFVMMCFGAVTFNFVAAIHSYLTGSLANYQWVLKEPSVIIGLLYLGLLSSVVAFFMLNFALAHLTASRVAVFLNLIPVVSLFAGMLFLHERLSQGQALGCALILLGIWGTNYFESEIEEESEETHPETLHERTTAK
ncbi:MAG: DMT family transporter [Clostridia bacterium]|nr:DMT family transporter [Clostridia bacterium]